MIHIYNVKENTWQKKEATGFENGTITNKRVLEKAVKQAVSEAFHNNVHFSFFGPKNAGIIVRNNQISEKDQNTFCDILYAATFPKGIAYYDENGISYEVNNFTEVAMKIAKKAKCFVLIVID